MLSDVDEKAGKNLDEYIMAKAPSPFCDPHYEWDLPTLSWKQVATLAFPGYNDLTSDALFKGVSLADVIKSREGRRVIQLSLQSKRFCLDQMEFVPALECALEEHCTQAKLYRARLAKQRKAAAYAVKKAQREEQKQAARAAKVQRLEERRLQREEREAAKVLAAQARIAHQQAMLAEKIQKQSKKDKARKKKRKRNAVPDYDDSDVSSSGNSSGSSGSSASSSESDTLHPSLRPSKLARTYSVH
jgi:hypothetical protein